MNLVNHKTFFNSLYWKTAFPSVKIILPQSKLLLWKFVLILHFPYVLRPQINVVPFINFEPGFSFHSSLTFLIKLWLHYMNCLILNPFPWSCWKRIFSSSHLPNTEACSGDVVIHPAITVIGLTVKSLTPSLNVGLK